MATSVARSVPRWRRDSRKLQTMKLRITELKEAAENAKEHN